MKQLVSDLNALYKSEPALHQVDFEWQGFEWLELHDWENSVLAFLRRGKDPNEVVIVVCNFTPSRPRALPDRRPVRLGFYREMLNTDSHIYGGSNVGNCGGTWAHHGEWGGRPFHLSLKLPPLGVVFLKREPS